MSPNYKNWTHLNEEGMKDLGDIFPDGIVPTVSMFPITFTAPSLDKPTQGYTVNASELTEEQVNKFVDIVAKKRGGEDRKEEIRKDLFEGRIPIRSIFTSGSGTSNLGLFMPDFDEEEEDDDWDDDEDWDVEDEEDWDDDEDWDVEDEEDWD